MLTLKRNPVAELRCVKVHRNQIQHINVSELTILHVRVNLLRN